MTWTILCYLARWMGLTGRGAGDGFALPPICCLFRPLVGCRRESRSRRYPHYDHQSCTFFLRPLAAVAAVDPAQFQAELVKMEHDFCTETLTPSVGPRWLVVTWLAVAAVYDRRSSEDGGHGLKSLPPRSDWFGTRHPRVPSPPAPGSDFPCPKSLPAKLFHVRSISALPNRKFAELS